MPIHTRRRLTGYASVLSLVGGVIVSVAPPARAASTNCAAHRPDFSTGAQDLDGDARTRSDVVTGAPSQGAGAVDIGYDVDDAGRYASRKRLTEQALLGAGAATGNRFGAAVAYVRLDADICQDLAVGAPNADTGRGAVVIAHGSPSGVGVAGGVVRLTGTTPGEHFGSAIATSTRGDLWIGAPGRTANGQPGAGAVDHYRVDPATGKVTFVESITQDTPGVPGESEADDHFGSVLATGDLGLSLVIGTPGEDVGPARDAGRVTRVTANDDGTPGIIDSTYTDEHQPRSGDHFGASLSYLDSYHETVQNGRLAVGAPGRAVGGEAGAGAVDIVQYVETSDPRIERTITQNSYRVPGTAEAGDNFGSSVQLGLFATCRATPANEQDPYYLNADVAIGARGEDHEGRADVGDVAVTGLRGFSDNPVCTRSFYRGRTGALGGTVHTGDHLGETLSAVHRSGTARQLLYVGVPGLDTTGARNAGVAILAAIRSKPTHASYYDSAGPLAQGLYGSVTTHDAAAG